MSNLIVALFVGHDQTKSPAESLDVLRHKGREADYLDDAELIQAERALLREFTTARIGHARRRCWPLDEVASHD